MRATAGPNHKALATVLGVPLIDWNLRMLLAASVRRIIVVVAHDERDLHAYVSERARELGEGTDSTIEIFVEKAPLGNIGALGSLRHMVDGKPEFIVVFVDNLTTVNLNAVIAYHEQSRAALTVATHLQRVRMPFGVVRIRGDAVVGYLEKPVARFNIASGIYCIAPRAYERIAPDTRMDVAELCTLLQGQSERIVSYHHDDPWIDVNDATALREAEHLVRTHRQQFELYDGTVG